ncbi:MAG: FtsX-like permease family protein [Lachnospiraceae bacterium]
MQISEIIRLVLINLRQNKSKVFLTSLGIIVGTITIVMVIAIGKGGEQDVAEQFKTLNAETITVSVGSSDSFMEGMMGEMGGEMSGMMPDMSAMSGAMSSGSAASGRTSSSGMSSGGATSSRASSGGMSSGGNSAMASIVSSMANNNDLDQDSLDTILNFVPNVVSGALSASTQLAVLGGVLEEEVEYTIIGTQQDYADISNLSLLLGEFITEYDDSQTVSCVVLGYTVAAEMFDSIMDAYDAKIEIDGRIYVVNGVLAATGSVVSGFSPDTSIFMPYSTAQKYALDNDATSTISILASDVSEVDIVMTNIELVLEQQSDGGTYTVEDAGATMEAAMESANTLSLLLLAVAVIVFIVGGIGIMNVLFVSVKERTREIGVLKAIGTKKSDILLLFLVEAAMMGVIGGMIGVAASFGIMPLMEYTDITVVMTMDSVTLAFIFAVVTSTIFGFYPAFQASNLVPIDALNNE